MKMLPHFERRSVFDRIAAPPRPAHLTTLLCRRSAVKCCIGVEIGEKRSAVAQAVSEQLAQMDPACPPFRAITGDMLKPIYSESTVIYFCNVIFDLQMQNRAVDNMLKTCPKLRFDRQTQKLHTLKHKHKDTETQSQAHKHSYINIWTRTRQTQKRKGGSRGGGGERERERERERKREYELAVNK
jgi:hypothetical protein